MNPDSNPYRGGQFDQSQIRNGVDPHDLTVEEIKMYKSCTYNLMFQAGLPVAIGLDLLTSFKAQVPWTAASLTWRAFRFSGAVLFGTLIFSPVCYKKLVHFHNENMNKRKQIETPEVLTSNEAVAVKADDFSYPTDLVSSFSEPEGTFSSDYHISIPPVLLDEEKKVPQATTYEQLRAQNRSQFDSQEKASLNRLHQPLISSEPLPQRRVKKNKYGDEIE